LNAAKTVFLDRDGVLNVRIMNGYVTCPEDLEILPGVPEALQRLKDLGMRLVVVTNQQGIAKGLMSASNLTEIHRHLDAATHHLIDHYYYCPHFTHEACLCRKPKPGMLDQADRDTPVDWQHSCLIGDSDSDIEAGIARRVYTIKVAGKTAVAANYFAQDLPAAVDHLLDRIG
jgi:D-glycero-D-manno-heptose 1,7-bisphosphate phosphatase